MTCCSFSANCSSTTASSSTAVASPFNMLRPSRNKHYRWSSAPAQPPTPSARYSSTRSLPSTSTTCPSRARTTSSATTPSAPCLRWSSASPLSCGTNISAAACRRCFSKTSASSVRWPTPPMAAVSEQALPSTLTSHRATSPPQAPRQTRHSRQWPPSTRCYGRCP